MKLKGFFLIFLLGAAILSSALFFSPYFIRQTAVRLIKNAVPGSEVTAGSCRFVRGHRLELRDIRLTLKTPSKNFPRPGLPGPGNNWLSFLVPSVAVKDLRLDVQTTDLSLQGSFSFTRDMKHSAFEDLSVDVSSLAVGGAQIKNIRASSDKPGEGPFSVENISFNKFLVEKLGGRFALSDAGVLLDGVSAGFLGGTLRGRLALTRLGETPVCTAEIDLDGIPIAAFLKLWEWDKKVSATGSLRGHLIVEIAGGKLARLDGALLAVSDGHLVILDEAFLQNIAARSKQPIEIVKASFEDYHYNTGTIGVSLEENDLRLHLDLDGEKGKRDLEVKLHDWF